MPQNLLKSLPDPTSSDPGESLATSYRLRPVEELYRKLDLFYRAHWCEVDARFSLQPLANFKPEPIVPRRWYLEWLMNPDAEWMEVDLST